MAPPTDRHKRDNRGDCSNLVAYRLVNICAEFFCNATMLISKSRVDQQESQDSFVQMFICGLLLQHSRLISALYTV